MAATVRIDHIDTLEMREKWGVITHVVRKAFVVGLSGTDWSVMYDVLDAAGVPLKGSYLDGSRASHLYVVDRDVRMTDKDKAEVTITYSHFNDRGQHLFWGGTVIDRNVAGKMTTNLVQKATNLYREGGVGTPQLITVEHTYPEDDPDYGGQTLTQSGTVDVHMPQKQFTIEGIKEVRAPWNMAEALVEGVNDRVWLGKAKHTWMCMEVTWEFRAFANYFMTFTFQNDPDTWNPTAVFVDDRTGRPPEGLVEGTGYKYLRYHREVNFVRELGFYVIGPSQ